MREGAPDQNDRPMLSSISSDAGQGSPISASSGEYGANRQQLQVLEVLSAASDGVAEGHVIPLTLLADSQGLLRTTGRMPLEQSNAQPSLWAALWGGFSAGLIDREGQRWRISEVGRSLLQRAAIAPSTELADFIAVALERPVEQELGRAATGRDPLSSDAPTTVPHPRSQPVAEGAPVMAGAETEQMPVLEVLAAAPAAGVVEGRVAALVLLARAHGLLVSADRLADDVDIARPALWEGLWAAVEGGLVSRHGLCWQLTDRGRWALRQARIDVSPALVELVAGGLQRSEADLLTEAQVPLSDRPGMIASVGDPARL